MRRTIFLLLAVSLFHFAIQAQSTLNNKLRGTWITNVASDAMLNKKNVEEAVLNWSEENDVYLWSVCDWFSITTGEALSDFTPSEVPNNRRRRGVRQRRGERIAYPEGQKTQFFN